MKTGAASFPDGLGALWRAARSALEDWVVVDARHLVLVFSVDYASPSVGRGIPKQFKAVLSEVENLTHLKFRHFQKERVTRVVERLRFAERAAVCDIGHGDHSILLTGKEGNWFFAFDPWWYGRRRRDVPDNLRFPGNDGVANVHIHKSHLLDEEVGPGYRRGKDYQMGKLSRRFLTVIEKP